MKNCILLIVVNVLLFSCSPKTATQFILFDEEFTFTYQDALTSSPSKSHYYVTHNKLFPNVPKDWTYPIDYRNGSVHIRIEVIEKPIGNAPTKWTLCYIPNFRKNNEYGCTSTDLFTTTGVFEKDVSMNEFWENESIIWSKGIQQMDLIIKDDSGGQGHAHKRPDYEKFFPTKVRITMIQVAKDETYNPKQFQHIFDSE
ncbi:hypothetical protein [Kordia zhangzhouensis]|uniref:hypothetical protein n=1 Tax=Kordia zhangzhouensis TaxID=1620405 RepID=UPI000629B543|nr:hypothetical protein [Kordia zhangzhouensis]